MSWSRRLFAALAALAVVPSAGATVHRASGTVSVGYTSSAALTSALRAHPARVVRRIGALRVAEVRPAGDTAAFVRVLRAAPGIRFAQPSAPRRSTAEPALAGATPAGAYEWQFAATRSNTVPTWVLRAASSVTIAVIDTGADLTAPDLAAKAPSSYSVVTGRPDVRDLAGHGTFVASLAAGSITNNDGIAGFGGDATLLVVQANRGDRTFTDVDEASAIVYAVSHGAQVINLSFGGPSTSAVERNAIDFAASHGALLVAAAGNEGQRGNPVEYPAALLQPVGSNGAGGTGLAVGASTAEGVAAAFSNAGSYLSLAAPGVNVLGALSSTAPATAFSPFALPGSTAGLYGYGSGTSYAAPQVAGAAALVWAANPTLTAQGVADALKQSATGAGTWSPQLGYGVIDVAAAVARAAGSPRAATTVELDGSRSGRLVRLSWRGEGAAAYRLSVRKDNAAPRVILSGSSTTASYALKPGHRYSFFVEAINEAGTAVATSERYVASVANTVATVKKTTKRG